jgi:hypothetical protein
MICLMGDVNVCYSKSKVHKSGFFCDSIATNDAPMVFTIEGKWLETIEHMIEFEFLNLTCSK